MADWKDLYEVALSRTTSGDRQAREDYIESLEMHKITAALVAEVVMGWSHPMMGDFLTAVMTTDDGEAFRSSVPDVSTDLGAFFEYVARRLYLGYGVELMLYTDSDKKGRHRVAYHATASVEKTAITRESGEFVRFIDRAHFSSSHHRPSIAACRVALKAVTYLSTHGVKAARSTLQKLTDETP